ncbi:MAG: ABC transporter permease [Candidatus Sumerlaeaceae bacterium]|nr:ABC transporter permease [Candidatus Sumerlaeaceae bacterium]
MGRFLLRRAVLALATLWLIATATFALMRSVPGGPFDSERRLPAAVEANIVRKYRLDQPLWRQYWDYMVGLLRLDLGPSFTQEGRTTNAIIRDGLPKTAVLGAAAFALSLAVGVPLGVAAALRRERAADRALMVASILGVSVPGFIVASLLQYVFSYRLGWLPAAGWGETALQAAMPAAALAAFHAAFLSRLVRSSLLGVLRSDYIRTARAKGVPAAGVVARHALRNALLPVLTYSGPLLAALLTGSFVIEDIFAIPGIGGALVRAINDRDYTVIMGLTLFYSALLVTLNLLVDILYAVLDPRISVAARE